MREILHALLSREGYDVRLAAGGAEGLALARGLSFDAAIVDVMMPGIDGMTVLEELKRLDEELPVIMITAFASVETAIAAMKRGAFDYITKPFKNDEVLVVLRNAVERSRLVRENLALKQNLQARYSKFANIVGRSDRMRQVFDLVIQAAPSRSTVLVYGESGTGKELVARAIHHNSPRRHHRFVALNCSAIPETLLEAELFGHVRGAFTGAIGTRQGRFEQAHRGTLFLDEVGTMSSALQTRLLRVLQEREFERVGESQPTRVDVRVIAATNSDLEQMVSEGAFREDLYYRLNVIPLRLPPLRERRDDIPLLVRHFLDRFGREAEPPRPGVVMSQEALRLMMDYAWPGNVRQLENVVERAMALSPGRTQIEAAVLPADIRQASSDTDDWHVALPDGGIDLDVVVARVEHGLIRQSLERTRGNKLQAARLLNVKRTTLVEKLKRLERPERPGAAP